MPTRRHFLQFTGMGIIGASLPAMEEVGPSIKKRKLSMQLYTVRDQIQKDIRGTLQRISQLGYRCVETAFWPEGITIDYAAQLLLEYQLGVSSCHIELPVGDHRTTMLHIAKAFQCSQMIWHGWPEDTRYGNLQGTQELIRLYNEAGRFAKDNGLYFGIHNHWWEFRNRVGGKFVYEVLAAELDPDIFFEIDTYWVKVAGHDPAKIVRDLGKRVRFLHVKDGPAVYNERLAIDHPDPMTAVGKGSQDFPAIFNAASEECEWLVVEMDRTATDVFAALEESIQFMKPYIKE